MDSLRDPSWGDGARQSAADCRVLGVVHEVDRLPRCRHSIHRHPNTVEINIRRSECRAHALNYGSVDAVPHRVTAARAQIRPFEAAGEDILSGSDSNERRP